VSHKKSGPYEEDSHGFNNGTTGDPGKEAVAGGVALVTAEPRHRRAIAQRLLAGASVSICGRDRAALQNQQGAGKNGVPVHTQIADVTKRQMLPILLPGGKHAGPITSRQQRRHRPLRRHTRNRGRLDRVLDTNLKSVSPLRAVALP